MNAEVIRLDQVPVKYTPDEPGISQGSDHPHTIAMNDMSNPGMRRRWIVLFQFIV